MINLTAELKIAMKAKDKPRKSVIVAVKGEIANYKIAKKKTDITDIEFLDLVRKVRKVSLEIIEWKTNAIVKSSDEHDALKLQVVFEKEKLVILNSWLPMNIGDDFLSELVDEAIATLTEPNMKQMGFVMSHVKSAVADRKLDVDGKTLSTMVKDELKKAMDKLNE
jgi:uncharacterized protein YqeY